MWSRPRVWLATCAASGLLLAATAALSDPQWIEIGVATDGTKVFVDRESLVENGRLVSANQRFLLAESAARRVRRVEQQVTYDCDKRVVSTHRSVEFDRKEMVIRNDRFDPPQQDRVSEDTLPALVLEVLC